MDKDKEKTKGEEAPEELNKIRYGAEGDSGID